MITTLAASVTAGLMVKAGVGRRAAGGEGLQAMAATISRRHAE
jgi:hypothetical protein